MLTFWVWLTYVTFLVLLTYVTFLVWLTYVTLFGLADLCDLFWFG
jgi:hypothetical protein